MIATLCIEVAAIGALVIHLADEEFRQSEWHNKDYCRDSYVEEDVGKTRHGVSNAPRPLSVRA
jgi:hypothetical protein